MADKDKPIIIKRVQGGGDGGHHGGGWKVAYADFMTAMMAFFLLLWILSAADKEKLRGLADYFTPALTQSGSSDDGQGGPPGYGASGVVPTSEFRQDAPDMAPSFGKGNPLAVFDSRLREGNPDVLIEYQDGPPPEPEMDDEERLAKLEKADAEAAAEASEEVERQEMLEGLRERIADTLKSDAELAELMSNVDFQITDQGLQIRILDNRKRMLFQRGSAQLEGDASELIEAVGQAITGLPQSVVITGHTDAARYAARNGYSNWELSADRANAARRILLGVGVPETRVARVSGVADTLPAVADDPFAPENRRITVTLVAPRGGRTTLMAPH